MKKRSNPKVEAMKERSIIVENDRKNLHTPKYYLNEEQDFSEYMRYVNVVGRSIAKEISGDDDAMYNELTPKIENWFMSNVNKISDMGDAATEHMLKQSKSLKQESVRITPKPEDFITIIEKLETPIKKTDIEGLMNGIKKIHNDLQNKKCEDTTTNESIRINPKTSPKPIGDYSSEEAYNYIVDLYKLISNLTERVKKLNSSNLIEKVNWCEKIRK